MPRLQRHRPRLRGQSLARLIPNMVTVMALSSGLTSIRFAFEGKFQLAVIAIILAAVLDALDGRIARLIGATSRFGAELDSLSDFISFGVAPAIVLYLWCFIDSGRIGWAAVLLFAVCMALRLARFNSALDDPDRPAWASNYFTGVPAPAGAGLVLMPLVASFDLEAYWLSRPLWVGAWMVIVAGLTVSRLPTFAFKKLKVRHWMVAPVLAIAGALFAGLASEPWLTFVGLGIAYLATFPFSIRAVRRHARTPPPPPEPVSPAASP
jgi:CDP-diacylglycerol--serine O-phosphatidyltransferase